MAITGMLFPLIFAYPKLCVDECTSGKISLGILNISSKSSSHESFEILNSMVLDNKNDVYFVPAFSGLGSPYWNDGARGMFIGITRNTGNKELISAVIKSIAFQVEDVIRIIRKKLGIIDLRCDGGSSRNDELMRFQARLSGINVLRSENPENTAAGIFYLNAVSSGIMKIDDIKHLWKFDRIFKPDLNPDSYINDYLIWRRAVRRSLNWIR